jgi:hypothetical protein
VKTKHFNIFFFIILYTSLILGFLYNENLNSGAYTDWTSLNGPITENFSLKFKETFLSYEKYGHRHSPVYLIFLSTFLDLELNLDSVRFINLHFSLSLIFIFYSCLNLKFPSVEKKYLQLLSLVIFLSPTFRSLSIWPDSRLPGLFFFTLSIYFFLKFEKNYNLKNAWFCSVALISASYISPNFSLFSIYFYLHFLQKIKFKNLLLLFAFNFISLIPALYYLFILEINLFVIGKTPGLSGVSTAISFNLSDKIMIISSIFLFHLFPVLLFKNFFKNFFNFSKKYVFIIFLITMFLAFFFNYLVSFTGGGFFFQLSQILFKNNYFFFGVCFFSLLLLFYLSKLNMNNFYLIVLIILSNIQNSIYHKYYEPMILIMFFTLFKIANLELFFKNKNNLIYLYMFSFGYIFLRLVKNKYYI